MQALKIHDLALELDQTLNSKSLNDLVIKQHLSNILTASMYIRKIQNGSLDADLLRCPHCKTQTIKATTIGRFHGNRCTGCNEVWGNRQS